MVESYVYSSDSERTTFREISFTDNLFLRYQIALKICLEHGSTNGITIVMLYAKFQIIEHLKRMLWTNEFLRDLSLRWFSDGYSILHSPSRIAHLGYEICVYQD